MAAKFVVAVAVLALCRANPVIIDGVLYRDGRAYSIGQASSYGGSGVSTAQADVYGGAAKAFGSSSGGAVVRDGYMYPGQAIAQAQTYDALPYPQSQAIAQAHNGAYYPLPAPATVITYEQNFAVPAEVSSLSTASSNGGGVAESHANSRGGVGSYGQTSSDAKTSGFGSAASNAKSGPSSTSTTANTSGQGSAVSSAQSNGVLGVVYPVAPAAPSQELEPAVIDAKTPIFHTTYVPALPVREVAAANAHVNGYGNAASSAKLTHGRTISWRFGTLYDKPTAAHAQANTGYGAAKSAAHTHGAGSANANADVHGYGSAKSTADTDYAGHSTAQSSANSLGSGSANANANANSGAYGDARSTANVHGAYYGGRSSADAQTHGFGQAASSARTQGLNAAYGVSNSQAHSSGFGSAHANALTV